MATSARILGSGWSKGNRYFIAVFRVVDCGKVEYRINIQRTDNGKMASRVYTEKDDAQREMSDILYGGKTPSLYGWH